MIDTLSADLAPQQKAAATQTGAVLVLAGAGTGKTKTLTEAVVHPIQVRGMTPSRILAVTFTNKAASEMAGRIRLALGGDRAPHWIGTFQASARAKCGPNPRSRGSDQGSTSSTPMTADGS